MTSVDQLSQADAEDRLTLRCEFHLQKEGESYLKGTTRLTCVNVKLTPKTKKYV